MALRTGQRPTALLLRDKYAGYRDRDDPYWQYTHAHEVNPLEWTEWDMVLATVSQLIEDYTDKTSGHLFWIDQSDKVEWEVRSIYSGSETVIAQERKSRELEPGETLYAVPHYDSDNPPTLTDWLEALENGAVPHGAPGPGHTEQELTDAQEAADKRRAEIAEQLRKSLL